MLSVLRGWAMILAQLLFLAYLPSFLVADAPKPQLHILPDELARERGARCLDHTPAGYYVRKQDPSKWVIFLEGGGLCVTPIDCQTRRYSHQGSSKYLKPDSFPEGAGTCSLSELNPFVGYSHVYIPYCSGDTWLGKSSKGHVSLLGLQMSGHLILEAVVDQLLNTTTIGSATDLVLSGSSAGGIGTFHHADWLADKVAAFSESLAQPPPRVVGVPIEGMFFPEKMPVLYPQFALGKKDPLDNFMDKYLSLLQGPWLPPACVQAAAHLGFPAVDCANVARAFQYTKTPMFIMQNLFDKLQIQIIGLCPSCKASSSPSEVSGKYIRFYGMRQNETVNDISQRMPQTGFFVPSEFHHDENFYHYFDSTERRIAGKSMREAFEAWYTKKQSVTLVEPTCNGGGPCQSDQTVMLV